MAHRDVTNNEDDSEVDTAKAHPRYYLRNNNAHIELSQPKFIHAPETVV